MSTRSLLTIIAAFLLTSLAVRAATANVAVKGTAFTTSPLYGGADIMKLIDGDQSSVFHGDTAIQPGFAYTVDLGKDYEINELQIFPRQDGCCADRLTNFRVSLHRDSGGQIGSEVWGANLFTDGTNPGSRQGALVKVPLPAVQTARWVQIRSLASTIPDYALQMTELVVLANVPENEVNRAQNTAATSNRPLFGGASASLLVDGNRGSFVHALDVVEPGLAYEINLGVPVTFTRIEIFARQDGCCPERLSNYRVSIHQDENGKAGAKVWSADLHTTGSNPESGIGAKDVLMANLDPAGTFRGQWIRIESLDAVVTPYGLQIGEIEAYGTPEGGVKLLLVEEPKNAVAGAGQTVTFTSAVNVVNGDPAGLRYQWQRDGVDIPGATNATYTIAAASAADVGKSYRNVISYAGLPSITTRAVTVTLNLGYRALAYSNQPLWSGAAWNISKLVNGDRTDVFHGDAEIQPGFAYEVDLGASAKLERIDIFPRQDACCPERLSNFRVSIHKDNAGKIGESVWSADFFADGTNPGSGAGIIVPVTANLNSTGTFEGQWIRILSLENPVTSYALQMTEMEVFGTFTSSAPVLSIVTQPRNGLSVIGRTATFSVEAKVLNGDASRIGYQWQKNGANIPGATNATYTTPPLFAADAGAKFRAVVSYPGTADLPSAEATLNFDSNYARGATAYSNRPLWASVWNISQLVNGDRSDVIHGEQSIAPGFAYEIDLGYDVVIDRIEVIARQDSCCAERLTNYRVSVHKDNNGKIGESVWSTDLHTDGSNPGELEGKKDVLTAGLNPGSKFEGRWVRILSLEDPVQSYALQMAEVEVYGTAKIVTVPLTLSVAKSGNDIVLTWGNGVLESADEINGTWTPVAGASSPASIRPQGARKFYRIR